MKKQMEHHFQTEPEFCQAMVDFIDKVGFPTKYKEHPLWDQFNAYADAHPEKHIMELRAYQYKEMAEKLVPHIFPQLPFFRKFADLSNGTNRWGAPGAWLAYRNMHLYFPETEDAAHYQECKKIGMHLGEPFLHDNYHHSVPHINILGHGLKYYYAEAEKELANTSDHEEQLFLKAAMAGLLALRRLAERFGEKADELLKTEQNPEYRENLRKISAVARKVPWEKPDTFYEALACINFCRHAIQTFEGLSLAGHLGLLDRMLYPYYKRDIENGILTPEQAKRYLTQIMIDPHMQSYVESFCDDEYDIRPWDKISHLDDKVSPIFLGGYDENHNTVCNELTFMIMDIHLKNRFLFPKLNLRITKDSPKEYLEKIAEFYMSECNTIAVINDETVFAAHLKEGKRPEDICNYVNSSCWELVIEGCEHSAGAQCYFNLARTLDLCINEYPDIFEKNGCKPYRFDGAKSFDEVLERYLAFTVREVREMCKYIGTHGKEFPNVSPGPLFSACLNDCIKKRKDYSQGGGRYNPHGLPMMALSNAVDSLLVIKHLCFDEKVCSLNQLLCAVRSNWQGEEAQILRNKALKVTCYGDGNKESSALAKYILERIHNSVRDLKNERGGNYQPGMYSAPELIKWGKLTGATPDGRYRGDVLSSGMNPSKFKGKHLITEILNTLPELELSDFPACASLDITLPVNGISKENIIALLKSFITLGGMHFQANIVTRKTLEDAMIHPEKHRDLYVRIYGLSLRFVTLTEEWKQELLSRPDYM